MLQSKKAEQKSKKKVKTIDIICGIGYSVGYAWSVCSYLSWLVGVNKQEVLDEGKLY